MTKSKRVLERRRKKIAEHRKVEAKKILAFLMFDSGMKQGQIASIFDVSFQTISTWCAEAREHCSDFIGTSVQTYYQGRLTGLVDDALGVYRDVLTNKKYRGRNLSTVLSAARDVLVAEGVIKEKLIIEEPGGGDVGRETESLIEELETITGEYRSKTSAGNQGGTRKKKTRGSGA